MKAVKAMASQLTTEHFKKERIQGQIDAVLGTADRYKATNVRQAATGVTDTIANQLNRFELTKYGDVTKAAGLTNFLLYEMLARDYQVNDFFKPEPPPPPPPPPSPKDTSGGNNKKKKKPRKKKPKPRELKGFKELMTAFKALEVARVAQEFPNDEHRASAAARGFLIMSEKQMSKDLPVSVAILLVIHFDGFNIEANTMFCSCQRSLKRHRSHLLVCLRCLGRGGMGIVLQIVVLIWDNAWHWNCNANFYNYEFLSHAFQSCFVFEICAGNAKFSHSESEFPETRLKLRSE